MSGEFFEGFTQETLDFFIELGFNNNKEWFDQNRDRYVKVLKEPMDLFAKELNERINKLDENFNCVYSVSRINRDIRFSKNKEPYRTSRWVVFNPFNGDRWQGRPVFYFELFPDGYVMGMGCYENLASYMEKFRKKADVNEGELERLIDYYNSQDMFKISGEKYKKKYTTGKNEKILDWYSRKNIVFHSKKILSEDIFSRKLLDKAEEGMKILIPFQKYFSTLVEN